MIRIDEIYHSVFLPKIIRKPFQTMHYFDPFGRTDIDALRVNPPILKQNRAFLFWDQEPIYTDYHLETLQHFHDQFVHVKKVNGERFTRDTNVTLVTSEKNSKNVKNICERFDYSESYYFFHGWAALDWYRGYNRTFLIDEWKNRTLTNTFICPNRIVGGNRSHRVDLFKQLIENNLVLNNKISFPKTCPFNNETFDFEGVDLPLVFDGEDAGNIPNESYAITLWNQAKNSLAYIVTETVYEQDTLHLTEKVFKPIVMQMPFVLVGAKHNLEYLRSYGFKTFGEFWDESYDELNNNERMAAIVNLLKDLNSLNNKDRSQLQKHLTPIVEHNYNWFYSNEFENLLWKELTNTMNSW